MSFKIKLALTIFLIACYSQCNAASVKEIISKIETNLSVEIVYNSKTTDSWSSIFYENCDDSIELKTYLLHLDEEYAKYPKGYFQLAGVSTIVLGKKMRFGEQFRAAIPDPYLHSLYLSINGA